MKQASEVAMSFGYTNIYITQLYDITQAYSSPLSILPGVPSPSRSLGYKLERDALLIPEFRVRRWLLN